jgi:hypothetical protein
MRGDSAPLQRRQPALELQPVLRAGEGASVIHPKVQGRWLPRNDWEGDDFTPGAGGSYVTCQDTAGGRMVAFATNGRIDRDGKVYRDALPGNDPDGISLRQLQDAVHKVAGKQLVIAPSWWTYSEAFAHLKAIKGLVVNGQYWLIPRAYRYQERADFLHALFISHYSPTSGYRVWDPLNPDTTAYGRWLPVPVIRAFIESLGTSVAYVPLDPL